MNTNFRYGPEEIRYLFENADAEAVVFHASYTTLIDAIRGELPKVKRWYVVDDPEGEPGLVAACPAWAVPYESVVGGPRIGTRGPTKGPWGRSGDDLLLLYTGGTTGMPKGVMWRQDDLYNVAGCAGSPLLGFPPIASLAELAERSANPPTEPPILLPGCPLMHGTGQFSAMIALGMGGSVVTLPARRFDAAAMWSAVESEGVHQLVIVGDAFARPLLAALDASPGRWNLSALKVISSSGVMWSQETKDGLLAHLPTAMLFDSLGSSEAVGLGASVSTKGAAEKTAKFMLGPTVAVFDDDNVRVEPGSERRGFVAVTGFIPLGYYKDEEKTAKTFRTIDGVRYSIPGDYTLVNADGTLYLLGRGSVRINTGGEKVFPEEVEEALKTHGSVEDAVCVGIPDDRFGEVICALIELRADVPAGSVLPVDVVAHVKERLAAYKAPRHVLWIDTIGRAPNGKVDYKRLTAHAREQLAL